MTLRIAVFAGAIAFASTAAWAQPPASRVNQPIVHSGLFLLRPDGRHLGSAVQTGESVGADMAGVVYIAPCGSMGASNPGRPVSAFATDVWLMSGKVLELTDEQASVQIGWRRTRSGGQDENLPEQTVTLTLKRGERNTLESIAVPASGSCEARNFALDVVFSTRSELYGISAADFAGGSRAFSGAGPGAGAGAGAGAGGRAGSGSGSGAGAGAGAGTGGVVSVRGGISSAGHKIVERLSADLWLVRSTPGRADETLHVTSQLMPIPLSFAFAPLTIQTATGSLTVKVEGTVEAGQSPDGERRFHFTATRNVTSVTTARPAPNAKPSVEGSTKTTVALPGPDEVLSFEMPPLRTPEGVSLPDRLSIRVRVAPSPK